MVLTFFLSLIGIAAGQIVGESSSSDMTVYPVSQVEEGRENEAVNNFLHDFDYLVNVYAEYLATNRRTHVYNPLNVRVQESLQDMPAPQHFYQDGNGREESRYRRAVIPRKRFLVNSNGYRLNIPNNQRGLYIDYGRHANPYHYETEQDLHDFEHAPGENIPDYVYIQPPCTQQFPIAYPYMYNTRPYLYNMLPYVYKLRPYYNQPSLINMPTKLCHW